MAPRGPIEPVRFTKNMTFFSNQKQTYDKDNQSLRLTVALDKPLVFIFAWLQASEKHLAKYAEFYLEQGFEVLCVHITPWQLVWPIYGSQKVAGDVVKFLTNNDFPEGIVIHGFSVGGYLWGECLVKLHADPTGRCVLEKIRGQVWDSLADITEIPVGVPHAVVPHNPTLQGVLRNYINYHMKLFHEEATQYYVKCTQLFHYEPALCPALLLVSKTDPVGTEKANNRLRDIWESVGVKTSLKCWDKSPHVGHFHKHRDEYIELLLAHLHALDLPMLKEQCDKPVNNDFKHGLILHGFSVGGYLWGECLVHIARDLPNYQVVLDRVIGQVWDSAADITEISVGVPRALFPKNPTLQSALKKYMLYHMKAFHEPATSHYIRSSQMFHTNLLRCPALFLISKTDPVGTVEANTRVKDSWEQSGVKTTVKCWDRSPHVGHFMKHREEYIDVLFNHLRQLNLPSLKQDALLRAKLTVSPPEANDILGISCLAMMSPVSTFINERYLLETVSVTLVPACSMSGVSDMH
uniref:Uncharacterized protein n=1 Tax=Anopheles culicifacies TaxID=139723 RepID=A0A182MNN9_9DIPT